MQTIESVNPALFPQRNEAENSLVIIHRQLGFQPKIAEAIPLEFCQGGFKVQSNTPLLFEEKVAVEWSTDSGNECNKIYAKVGWIRSIGDSWIIGLALDRALTAEAAEQLSSICKGQRRKSERTSIQIQAEVKRAGETELQPVTLLDCSQSGFSFQISEPVEVGQPIMLQLSHGDQHMVSIMGKAKWISREGSDYRVGCEVSEICRETFNASLRDKIPSVLPVARSLLSRKWAWLGAALCISSIVGWVIFRSFSA
ncbi:MAG: PilZ domain-containing protein [bacterium]|nr:PilZ domain-containing protein [bacterium]